MVFFGFLGPFGPQSGPKWAHGPIWARAHGPIWARGPWGHGPKWARANGPIWARAHGPLGPGPMGPNGPGPVWAHLGKGPWARHMGPWARARFIWGLIFKLKRCATPVRSFWRRFRAEISHMSPKTAIFVFWGGFLPYPPFLHPLFPTA